MRQVNVRGLVATAFTRRDSRTGDRTWTPNTDNPTDRQSQIER